MIFASEYAQHEVEGLAAKGRLGKSFDAENTPPGVGRRRERADTCFWRHRKRIIPSTSKLIYVRRESHEIEQIDGKTEEWKVEFGSRTFRLGNVYVFNTNDGDNADDGDDNDDDLDDNDDNNDDKDDDGDHDEDDEGRWCEGVASEDMCLWAIFPEPYIDIGKPMLRQAEGAWQGLLYG